MSQNRIPGLPSPTIIENPFNVNSKKTKQFLFAGKTQATCDVVITQSCVRVCETGRDFPLAILDLIHASSTLIDPSDFQFTESDHGW